MYDIYIVCRQLWSAPKERKCFGYFWTWENMWSHPVKKPQYEKKLYITLYEAYKYAHKHMYTKNSISLQQLIYCFILLPIFRGFIFKSLDRFYFLWILAEFFFIENYGDVTLLREELFIFVQLTTIGFVLYFFVDTFRFN